MIRFYDPDKDTNNLASNTYFLVPTICQKKTNINCIKMTMLVDL